MMKMSGRVTGCCVALLLTLTSVSAIQRLNSINDLKEIIFGQSVPKHTLLLLHWFANVVDIDNNNINIIRLTFDPNRGDYGSHHYGNYERLLDPLPYRYRYYTVGNLNEDTSEELPNYVVHPQTGYDGNNRDRIIFSVSEQSTGRRGLQRIDRVFITQHYGHQGTDYDPDRTYEISANLLRDIRQFSTRASNWSLTYLRNRFGSSANDSQLRHIRNSWGDLACLGLLLFIVIQEGYSSNQHNKKQMYFSNQHKTTQRQHATVRNTQSDYSGSFAQNGQNHRNADTCVCFWGCIVFLLIILAIFSIKEMK